MNNERLRFNPDTNRYGLYDQRWINQGFIQGDILEIKDENGNWIQTSIEKDKHGTWYLSGTRIQGNGIEGIEARLQF